MKNRALKILASTKWLPLLLLLALPAVAQAQYYYTNSYGIWDYTPTNGPVTITGFTSTGSNVVVIPDTINSYPVTSIGYAFNYHTTLTGVTIPDSVTNIVLEAFYACSGLTNIVVNAGNASYASAGGVLFDKAMATLITYPEGLAGSYAVPGSVTSIGELAFEYCSGLTSVTIPSSVTNIGDGAFEDCYYLASIAVDAGNANYASAGGVLFNKTLTTLIAYPPVLNAGFLGGSYAIPNSVTNIADYAFYDASLASVAMGNGVTSIGEEAFWDCSYLKSVTMGNSVTSVGDEAFALCNNLKSVTIPDSVTSIGAGAFENCYDLTGVAIGKNVTTIGQYAFNQCSSLTGVYFAGNCPTPTNDSTVFSDGSNPTIYYQPGTTNWSTLFDGQPTAQFNLSADFNYTTFNNAVTITGYTGPGGAVIIPSKINGNPVTDIEYPAFQGNSSVTSVMFFGTNLTTIGSEAFENTGLSSVAIPDNVTSIGVAAFQQCYSLNSVAIGENVTSIGGDAFYYCGSLWGVAIPNSVTSIGIAAFEYCFGLRSVTMGNSVTSIGSDAFYNSGPTSITIPASVTSIGSGAFDGCEYLTNITVAASNPDYSSLNGVLFNKAQVTLLQFPGGLGGNYIIPASVTSIGDYAFLYCDALAGVTIGSGVTNIGYDNFVGCPDVTNYTVAASNPDYSSLNGVWFDKAQVTLLHFPDGLGGSYTIPNSVTSIGTNAFEQCQSLTNVTIPNSVTNIEQSAFESCYSLTNVIIPDSVTSIGNYAFYYCLGLTSVTIGNGVTSLGEEFYDCPNLTKVIIGTGVTNLGNYAFNCPSLTGVYFEGNSPMPTNNSTVFSGDSHAVAYYLPTATGWGTLFDGLPATVWLPQIQASNGSFGVQSNQFGFNISWAGNMVVVVEAATNLANPVWIPVSTNTLANGASSFSDPQWTNYPGRYYRLRSQ